jgi:hypothetical protein
MSESTQMSQQNKIGMKLIVFFIFNCVLLNVFAQNNIEVKATQDKNNIVFSFSGFENKTEFYYFTPSSNDKSLKLKPFLLSVKKSRDNILKSVTYNWSALQYGYKGNTTDFTFELEPVLYNAKYKSWQFPGLGHRYLKTRMPAYDKKNKYLLPGLVFALGSITTGALFYNQMNINKYDYTCEEQKDIENNRLITGGALLGCCLAFTFTYSVSLHNIKKEINLLQKK